MPDTGSDSQIFNDREQIQYLLGNPPSWMMRYGISVFAGVFSLMVALTYFISYPDVIEAKVVLTTALPPIRVIAKSSGRVAELLVTDNQIVKQGQVMAVIENTGNWRDVLNLEYWLDSTQGQTMDLLNNLNLGELQTSYSAFSQNWKDLNYFTQYNGVAGRISHLKKQISQLESMYVSLLRQKETVQEEFALAEKAYRRQQQLFNNKVISEKEFETSRVTYLAQKRQFENAESLVTQNQIQIGQLENQINDLRQNKLDSENDKRLTLFENLQILHSAISEWKQTFLVIAPISGQVSFTKIWSAQQSISAGEEVLAIVPTFAINGKLTQIVGKVTVPSPNFGKIIKGQRVIVRLDGYPPQQYGVLEATVGNISLLPQKEETYLINLNFLDSLVTSHEKIIPLRQEMTGQARIVTEDRRLIDRIFGSLRDLLQNN